MRICVKNLPAKITEDDLKKFFREKGEITDVYMLRNNKNEFRRVAFIGYKLKEDANNAKEYFDKSMLWNHKITVDLAEEEKKYLLKSCESLERKIMYSKTIYIINLIKDIECEEIKKEAEKFGQVTEISIIRDSEDGKIKEIIVKYKESISALKAFKELRIICGMRIKVLGRSLQSTDDNKSHYNTLFFDFESVTKKACESWRMSKKDLIDIHDDKLGSKISVIETDLINQTKKFLENKNIFIDRINGVKNKKRLILRNSDIFSVLEIVKGKYKVSIAPSKCLCLLDFENEKEAFEACKNLNLKRFKNKIIYCEFAPLCDDIENNNINNENKNMINKDKGIIIKDKNVIIEDKSLINKDKGIILSEDKKYNKKIKLSDEKQIHFIKQSSIVENNDKKLNSQFISLKPKITSKLNTKKCYKVIIKNVPFQATKDDLQEVFSSFTEIVEIRLPLKNKTSHRGFGFMILNSDKSVEEVIEYFGTGTHLFGRRLVLERARS